MSNRSKLAVMLHADVVGSTALVQKDERVAHDRMQDAFRRMADVISAYGGTTHELRGDALVAEFSRASDAVCAGLQFQQDHTKSAASYGGDIRPQVRIGIALGEVVIADDTVTGAGIVLAQRLEQHAQPGGLCISAAVHEALPARLPFEFESLGYFELKGFEDPVRVFSVSVDDETAIPSPEPAAATPTPVRYRGWQAALVVCLLLIGAAVAIWTKPWQQSAMPGSEPAGGLALPDRWGQILTLDTSQSRRQIIGHVDGSDAMLPASPNHAAKHGLRSATALAQPARC